MKTPSAAFLAAALLAGFASAARAADETAAPTPGPAAHDPYKDTYKAYRPPFIQMIVDGDKYAGPFSGWTQPEKVMRLSSEPDFYTLNMLSEDARANALVDAALAKEAQGQYREALKMYQIVIEKYPQALYRVSRYGVFAPVAQYCQRRILNFPQTHLDYYRTLFDARAKEVFDQARAKYSLEGLAELRDSMLATSYGGRSLLTLGMSALDSGRYYEALEHFEQVEEYFPDPGLRGAQLAMPMALCRKMLGQGETAGERYGLVGHWKLDEGTGNKAADSSGSGCHGTVAEPPNWTQGRIGGALHFDRLPNYRSNSVSVPPATPINVGIGGTDFSVAFWLNWETGSYPNAVFTKRGRTANDMLNLEVTGNRQLRYTIATQSPTWETGTTKRTITAKTWAHIAFVKVGADVKVFIDGKLDLRDTLKAPALQNLGGVTFAQSMDGCMDDVRLYNRALLDREVADFAGTMGAVTMTASPVTGAAPLAVEFDYAAADTGAPARYLWEFGDGDTATGPKAKHTYTLGGEYTVVMTVTDPNGAVSVARSKVNAKWPPSSEEFAKTMGGVLSAARSEKAPWVSQLASAPHIASDDYTLFPSSDDPAGVKPPTWTATLPGSRNDFFAFTEPVITENSVIYRHKNIVYCRSLLTGELRWQNDLGGRATWQNFNARQYPREDILVQDRLVFAPMNKVGATLVALDQITGQLKWAYGPMVASTEEEARMRFEAAPAGGPRTVYAAYVLDNIEGDTHTDTEYGIIAFESATGRLLWRTPVCTLAPGKFAAGFAQHVRNRIRSFTSPPLYHEGTVYYTTNAGAVAALDALSGQLKWTMRYPYWPQVHDATRQFGGLEMYENNPLRHHRPMFWYNQRPLLIGEDLYVAPVDTPMLFRIDRRTGKIAWVKHKDCDGSAYLLGANDKGELVIAWSFRRGGGVHLLDHATGDTLWRSGDPVDPINHPAMSYYFYFGSGVGIGADADRWDYQLAARPFLAADGTVCLTSFHYWAYPVYGWISNLTHISVNGRKTLGKRRYLSGEIVSRARYDIGWAPDLLKSLEDLPHKDEATLVRMQAYREMAADTVPVNEYGPFLPFSRTIVQRYGSTFELRTSPRDISVLYDRDQLRRTVTGRRDPDGLFASAELAMASSRLDEAADLMKKALASLSSEDVDFRAAVNQQLYRVHSRLAQSAIRSGQLDPELDSGLGMSRTATTLPEEIETLFALAEAYERRGDPFAAARCLRSIANTYGPQEYPIAPVAEDRAAVTDAAKSMFDHAAGYAGNTAYGNELTRSIELARRGLPLYFSTVSPLPKPLTVRAGELAAARLVRLQRAPGAADFAKAFDALAAKELEAAASPDERLYRLPEFPGTAAAQKALDDLSATAARLAPSDQRRRLWQLSDLARVCGLRMPPENVASVSAPPEPPPPAALVLPPAPNRLDISDPEGINWLLLPRRGDDPNAPNLVFLGGRVRKRLDNKFILACMDLAAGKQLWKRENIRLKGTGQEPGFFEAFVLADIVVVHGLYDVLAFDLKTGTPRWQFRGPFDFEIKHAVQSGDILVLAGKSETLALHVPTDSASGEVAWQKTESGDLYSEPYFVGDRLICVRKMPFSVTVRFRNTGNLIGRLEIPDLSLLEDHPLIPGGPPALPVAHDGDLLVVTDGWYYIALDTKRLRTVWKRLIDQNDPTREPAMRFTIGGDYLLVLKEDYDQKAVYMLASRTGEVLWKTDPKSASSPQPIYSTFIVGDRLYGLMPHPGQAFYFASVDCKTGRLLRSQEIAGYEARPQVSLLPRLYGQSAVAQAADRQDFELRVFDAASGRNTATLKKKGVGPFGEHGRVSAVVQNGRLVFLSKDDLSL